MQECLNARLTYVDGELFWKPRTLDISKNEHQMNAWNARYSEKTVNKGLLNSGYRYFSLNGKSWLLHRAIYTMHHGLPNKEVDHINGDKLDNRIENLRPATSSQNKHNARPRGGNSKHKGVYWNSKDKRWRAQASLNGTVKYLGNFKNETDAAQAYNEFAEKYYDLNFVLLNEA